MDTKILGQHAARERDNHRTVLAAAIDLAVNEIDNLRGRLAAVTAERDDFRELCKAWLSLWDNGYSLKLLSDHADHVRAALAAAADDKGATP